jgi:hypothetical protein
MIPSNLRDAFARTEGEGGGYGAAMPPTVTPDEYLYARQYWLDHIALAASAHARAEIRRARRKLAELRHNYYRVGYHGPASNQNTGE